MRTFKGRVARSSVFLCHEHTTHFYRMDVYKYTKRLTSLLEDAADQPEIRSRMIIYRKEFLLLRF